MSRGRQVEEEKVSRHAESRSETGAERFRRRQLGARTEHSDEESGHDGRPRE